jgi:hypothetical protein
MKTNLIHNVANGLMLIVLIAIGGCQKDLRGLNTQQTPATQKTPTAIVPNLSTTGIGGYDLNNINDLAVAYGGDNLLLYRPGSGPCWLLSHTLQNTFVPAFKSNNGIAGYNLLKNWDLITPFDYEHSGKQDYLMAYRPGLFTGYNSVYIIKDNWTISNPVTSFTPVYASQNGIGGITVFTPMKFTAFDYDHSGKLDYLLCAGFDQSFIAVLKNNNGTFTKVFQSTKGLDRDLFYDYFDNTTAAGVHDAQTREYIFAFDYNHSGLQDHLVHCNSGHGPLATGSYFHTDIYIDGHNPDGTWTTKTILNFDGNASDLSFQGTTSQCIAYDYEHSGKADYLLVIQPNPTSPRVYIYKNNNDGTMTAVYQQINGFGLGGWDFKSLEDHIIAYDYEHSGKLDYLFVWRAGSRVCSIIKHNADGSFTPVL